MTNQETNSNHKYDPDALFEKWEKNMKLASSAEEQLLSLTHHKEINNGIVKYISYLADAAPEKTSENSNNVPNKNENPITPEHEILLIEYSAMHSKIIDRTFIPSEDLHQYIIDSVKDVLSFLDKTVKNDENSSKIFNFLAENLEFLQKNPDCPDVVVHSMCYTMEILIFALIEKSLRIILIDKNKENPQGSNDKVKKNNEKEKKNKNKKKDLSSMSLGKLLWDETVAEIFTQTHLINLRYFLSTCSSTGLDLRNDFVHCKDFDIGKFTPYFVYHMLYLFTDVLNTAQLYFLKQQKK